jgi:hypothetical protein
MKIESVSDYLAKCFANPIAKDDDMLLFYRGVNQIYPNTLTENY